MAPQQCIEMTIHIALRCIEMTIHIGRQPGDEPDDDQGVNSLLLKDLVQLGRMESVKSILY